MLLMLQSIQKSFSIYFTKQSAMKPNTYKYEKDYLRLIAFYCTTVHVFFSFTYNCGFLLHT